MALANDDVVAAAEAGSSADDYQRLKSQDLLYRQVLAAVADGILVLKGYEIVDCNERLEQLFELDRDQIVGRYPWQIGTADAETTQCHESRGCDFMQRAYAGERIHAETEFQSADGRTKSFNLSLARFELPDGPRLLCRLTEVTELVRARSELQSRADFQDRLFDLGSRMLTAQIDELPGVVSDATRRICEDYQVERASVWWLQRSSQIGIGNLPVGHGDDTTEFIVQEFGQTPWMVEYLLAENRDYLRLPEQLPEYAECDRQFLDKRGIRSMLLFPLRQDEDGVCIATMSMRSETRDWTREECGRLQLLLQRVGAGWARYVRHYLNREGDRDLRRSQRVAQVGSYQIVPADEGSLSWTNARLIQTEQARRIRGTPGTISAYDALLEHVHDEDRDQVEAFLQDIGALDRATHLQYRIPSVGGSVVYVEERFEVDRNADGSIQRVFGTIQDVTGKVKTAVSLMKALEEIKSLKNRLEAQNFALREEVRVAKGFDSIIGRSDPLRRTLKAAETVSGTDVTVLILGETGTGKDLVARSIHESSGRHDGPMVSVNCAALSADLIESELFGHERGAFTHAVSARRGRFELAHGGTLFLDEIAELPLDVQAKLLRVLQTGDFERLGGTKTIEVDTRVIAATNRNLARMVETGEFRADLFYRINHFPVELPPLRERREDIPALANHFLEKHAKALGRNVTSISERMLGDLVSRDWPGNVRELESYIQRAIIRATGTALDQGDALPGHRPSVTVATVPPEDPGKDEDLSLESMQRRHIVDALERYDWTVDGDGGAAAALGLPPSSLRSKMKRLGIERP